MVCVVVAFVFFGVLRCGSLMRSVVRGGVKQSSALLAVVPQRVF